MCACAHLHLDVEHIIFSDNNLAVIRSARRCGRKPLLRGNEVKNVIDHIAIGASTLDQGVNALRDLLGVEIPRGGKHPDMSTHNCLTRTGDGNFLEVIAIDLDAPAPGRVRWFTLDDPVTQARLNASPGALCWVVGTDDLDGIVANSPFDHGEILHLSRGDLRWRLTVPKDGNLLEGGLLPAFIEWSPGPHPSGGMQDLGIRLKSVQLRHPDPNALQSKLQALSIEHLAEISEAEESSLAFVVETPDGRTVELN